MTQTMNDIPVVENLWSFIAPSLKKNRKRTAWICREGKEDKRVVKYGELEKAALTTAALLRSEGVKQGDTVGVTAPNGPEWCVAALAAWKLGAKLAPIHIGNSPSEIASQVLAIKPDAMLGFNTAQLTDNQHLISLEFDTAAVEAERAISAPNGANEEALSIYTSGSTGTPKVVKLSHQNMGINVYQALDQLTIDTSDRFISLLPLSHAMGITATMLFPLYMGAKIVTPRVIAAAEILATITEENITFVVAVPRLFRNIMLGLDKKFNSAGKGLQIYRRLLERVPLKLRTKLNAPIRKKLGGNIKCWVSGGSHLDGKIIEFYHKLGIPLRQGYGLTETAPMLCVQTEFDDAIDSVGKPVKWAEVKVVNPDELGRGEIFARGPNLMMGYEDESQTKDVMIDGWFKTGDLGRVDAQGRVTLTGRSKRLIVTDAGKNVYPEELETLLERDPRLKEAGVLEKKMKPVVVLAMEGENPIDTAREVLQGFNNFVSSHNQINRFAVVEELPRTPLGKIALQELPAAFKAFEVKSKGNK
ncbi:MAG: long-chain acyl-CoA synthetase [Saprospiraceae bacterium]|jgi:long-chain acyl-CoA synthetase